LWCIDPLLGSNSVNTFPREPTCATIGRLLLGNGSVNTLKIIRDNTRWCFPLDPPRWYITRSSKGAVSWCQKLREFSWRRVHLRELMSRIGSSSGDVSRRGLIRNGKKESRLCKEDFICDLKWQWDCYQSVAWIRLTKTKNICECVTVN
jgi:hypothetical protein